MKKLVRGRVHWLWRVGLPISVIAAIGLLWLNRIDPADIPQERLHNIATRSDEVDMSALIEPHPVKIEPIPEDEWVSVLVSYLPPPIGSGGQAEVQGLYDPETETVKILGRMARLQAALPEPRLQPVFRHTLRHEYGHAFLADWMKRQGKGDKPFLGFHENAESLRPERFPEELRPVAEEYMMQPSNLYGPAYFTSSFEEYMAESYARFLDGSFVPVETKRFLENAAGQGHPD